MSYRPVSQSSRRVVEAEETDRLVAEDTTDGMMADDRIRKIVKEEIINFNKRATFVPHANIYRCWAIGLIGGSRIVLMTCCAIAVQIIGPIMVMDYSRRMLSKWEQGTTFEHFESLYQRRTGNQVKFSLFEWLFHDAEARKLLEIKVLGSLLLALIFMSTDRQLLEQEMETNNLRRFFQLKSCRAWTWLWIDAFCNGLAFMCIALCLGTFISYENSVPDLLLDAIGLYFMSNVDNIGLDIRYGVPLARYEELVRKAHTIWAKAHCKGELSKLSDQEHVTACGPLPILQKSSIVVGIARALNCFIYSMALPTFIIFTPIKEMPAGTSVHAPFGFVIRYKHLWLPWSILILLGIGASNVNNYCKIRKNRKEGQKEDCEFFMSHFMFRRPDTSEQSDEAARELVAKEARENKIDELEAQINSLMAPRKFGWQSAGGNSGGGTTASHRQCNPNMFADLLRG